MSASDQGVLVLSNDDIKQILDLSSYTAALQSAFVEMDRETAANMPRQRLNRPLPQADTHYWFNLLAGVVPGADAAALRVNSGHVQFTEAFGRTRMEYPGGLVGLVVLFEISTGAVQAIIHDFYINPIRVACTSALGVKYLKPPEAQCMGLFGSGWQARWHLSAILAEHRFQTVNVYSPNAEHRRRFVAQQQHRFPNTEIVAVDRPEAAVRCCQVVVTATNALKPVFDGDWVEPGTLVVSISGADHLDRRQEIDIRTVARSSPIVVNSLAQVKLDAQLEIVDAIQAGHITWDDVQELGDVIRNGPRAADYPGRIAFHFNNTGMGIQFAAVGRCMVQQAVAAGVGTRLPFTWRGRNL